MSPLTGVLTEAWALYRKYAAHFLLIAFVIYLITGIVVGLLSLAGRAGIGIGALISFIASFVVQTSLIKAVQDVRDGRVDLDLGQTVRAALPYLLPVIGASILAGIAVTIGFILLIVPGLILLTFWCLIVPFIVVGGSGALASFGNSWRTVRGYAWRVFGTYVLVFLILIAFSIVLGLILAFLHSLFWRNSLSNLVSGTLVTPFLALVATLIYYRLTAAHAGQPYAATPGTAPSTVWEPPYPGAAAPESTATPGPAPENSAAPGSTAPGSTAPFPPAEPPASGTPPEAGPGTPPPPPPPGGP
jgi:hypothetical protein